jgi:hypothetical protein
MHYHYLATIHFSTTYFDWPRPTPIFQATASRARCVWLSRHNKRMPIPKFSRINDPAKISLSRPRISSCLPPQSLAILHPQILRQIPPDKQIYKSTIHFLENNLKSYYTPKPIRWGATPSPTTARAPAPAATAAAGPAAPATRQSPTDTTTSKQAYKSSAS